MLKVLVQIGCAALLSSCDEGKSLPTTSALTHWIPQLCRAIEDRHLTLRELAEPRPKLHHLLVKEQSVYASTHATCMLRYSGSTWNQQNLHIVQSALLKIEQFIEEAKRR